MEPVFARPECESYIPLQTPKEAEMNYRIRYRQPEGAGELEATVEANSPTEAVVKFRCTREYRPHPAARGDLITSVCPVERPDTVLW